MKAVSSYNRTVVTYIEELTSKQCKAEAHVADTWNDAMIMSRIPAILQEMGCKVERVTKIVVGNRVVWTSEPKQHTEEIGRSLSNAERKNILNHLRIMYDELGKAKEDPLATREQCDEHRDRIHKIRADVGFLFRTYAIGE